MSNDKKETLQNKLNQIALRKFGAIKPLIEKAIKLEYPYLCDRYGFVEYLNFNTFMDAHKEVVVARILKHETEELFRLMEEAKNYFPEELK